MAGYIYRLTYFVELAQADGGRVRVEFYAKYDKAEKVTPKEIGDVVQGLSLEVQGQSEDIDAPIVKTSLIISFVDAPERNTDKLKCGDWEQFYTSDATGWKVVLLGKSKGEVDFRTLWGGYVTPDSYTETLQHHGVVTITARDNIGHLQDFEFDAKGNGDGMITPYDLITQAWEKINSPMSLDWRGAADSNEWPQADGVDIIYTYINVSMFKGRTWYDAVSETLYSMGLVMRYIGNNYVGISTLRRLPAQGLEYVGDLPHVTPTFMAYATRELLPAVKEINEEDSYDLQDGEDQPQVTEDDFDGTTVSCTINVENAIGGISQKEIAVWPIMNEGETGWGNFKSNTLFFDITRYNVGATEEPAKGETLLAVNSEARMVWYGRNITCIPLTMKIEQGMMVERYGELISQVPSFAYDVERINGALKLTHNGTEYYYDGETWGTSYKELNLQFKDGVVEQYIAFNNITGPALLQLYIFSIDVDWRAGNTTDKGNFLGIKLNFSRSESVSMLERNTVNTKYDETNNVKLSRTPSLAPAFDTVAIPGIILNGIFNKDGDSYVPAPEWMWPNTLVMEPMQLPTIVHQQLLCYHSKPNNLISGTIVNADLFNIRAIWMWKGKEHLLLSGTYNFLTGRIEGATLREFIRYEDLFNN